MPSHFVTGELVAITPKNGQKHSWIQPRFLSVDNEGYVTLINDSGRSVVISRMEHFADIIPCSVIDIKREEQTTDQVKKVYYLGNSHKAVKVAKFAC